MTASSFRILPIVLIPFLLACQNEGPPFHRLEKGIEHRRVTLGEGRAGIGLGEGVGIFYRITPPSASEEVLAQDTSYFLLDRPEGAWTSMLETMAVGDSSIFLLERELLEEGTLNFQEKGSVDTLSELRLEVRTLDHRKPSALMEWKMEKEGELEEEQWREWERIESFVSDLTDSPEEHFVEGIYAIPEKRGQGAQVKAGREVAVHYRGYLPDSTVFDDSYKREEPLRFRFGDPGQVIRGMGIGLKYMREGGVAHLVIPSYLAFGKKGGRTGILPPHTFVYYKIEVVEVKRS